MTRENFGICVIFVIIVFFIASCSQSESNPLTVLKDKYAFGGTNGVTLPFPKGEAVIYTIKSLGLNVGEASLTFQGLKKLGKKEVFLITFRAEAMNFLDEEKIYADSGTFYPVRVERNLNIWGKKERITEDYDQQNGTVSIAKDNGETQEIKKKGKIDNIYCFIYRYRRSGEFQIGDSFSMTLPTKDVTVSLVKTASIKTAGRKFDAFYMESVPAQYKVWFDTSERKIPLRINGSVGINAAMLTMDEYRE